MSLAGRHGHEHWTAVDNATTEDDVVDTPADLPCPRKSGRHELIILQQRLFSIAEANDLRMQIGELLTRLGTVASDKSRRMEYLQRALSVFRELGAKSRMKDVQTQVHNAVMGR